MNTEYLEPSVIEQVAIAPVIHLTFKLRIVHVSPLSLLLPYAHYSIPIQFDTLVRVGNERNRVCSGQFSSPKDPGVVWSLSVVPVMADEYSEATEIKLSQDGLPVSSILLEQPSYSTTPFSQFRWQRVWRSTSSS